MRWCLTLALASSLWSILLLHLYLCLPLRTGTTIRTRIRTRVDTPVPSLIPNKNAQPHTFHFSMFFSLSKISATVTNFVSHWSTVEHIQPVDQFTEFR